MVVSSRFVFARHFFTRGTVRPGLHPVCFRTVSCSGVESGMLADSTFWGAGGTAGPGNRDQGDPIPFWVLTNAVCSHLPADLAPPPYCAYKAVFFFFLRLVMLLVRTLDRHWFMFLSSYKCSDLQAGNIADCT